MRRFIRNACAAIASGVAFWIACAAFAVDSPVPVGGEFQVNVQAQKKQYQPDLYANASGETAVVWTDDTNIRITVFHRDGTVKVTERVANSTTPGTQNEPQITLSDDGLVAACWTDYTGADGELLGVLAQRFDAEGAKLGPEFVVTDVTQGSQWEAMVANGGSNLVFVWVDSIPGDGSNAGIFGKIYDWDGVGRTEQFLVNDSIAAAQVNPSLAVYPDGSFVVAWQDRSGADGSQGRILVKRFRPDGDPLFSEVSVNLTTAGDQTHPSVAALTDGSFAVAFTDWGGSDGGGGGVYLRIFEGSGTPKTGEILVNETVAGDQGLPEVASDGEHLFFVTWNDYGGLDGSGAGVFRRAFDVDGNAVDSEDRVNTNTGGNQFDTDVTMSPLGDITVVWEDESGIDGDLSGIYGQRYFFEIAVAVPASGWLSLILLTAGLILGAAVVLRRA